MSATELRDLTIEAATCLICAGNASCTDPESCHRDAAHYISLANRLLAGGPVEVETVALGKVSAFIVTDSGRIRVHLPDGGTSLVDGVEVLR